MGLHSPHIGLSGEQITREYIEVAEATTYSLARKYGCCQDNILMHLHRRLDPDTRKRLERQKKSLATKRWWASRKQGAV